MDMQSQVCSQLRGYRTQYLEWMLGWVFSLLSKNLSGPVTNSRGSSITIAQTKQTFVVEARMGWSCAPSMLC
jgi:hypothetical protein